MLKILKNKNISYEHNIKLNLPEITNAIPKTKVMRIKRLLSGVQHWRNINDPIAEKNVIKKAIV